MYANEKKRKLYDQASLDDLKLIEMPSEEELWDIERKKLSKVSYEEKELVPEFRDATIFNNYKMEFLKKPFVFQFSKAVNVQKTSYNYKLQDLAEKDRKRLLNLFKKLNPEISANHEMFFINGKKGNFLTKEGDACEPKVDDTRRYKIRTLLQGFKTNKEGFVSPVWRIEEGVLYQK